MSKKISNPLPPANVVKPAPPQSPPRVGLRQDYIEAVKEEFSGATRDELIAQIAHCWKKIDRLQSNYVYPKP